MSSSTVPEPPLAEKQAKSVIVGSVMARAALYGGLVASAGTIVVFAYYFVTGEQQQMAFCCSDVIQLLASTTNWSVDPCSNFMDFACSHVRHLEENALGIDVVETSVVRPVLLGQLNTAAANRLHTHHRSCLTALVGGELSPENAVRMVVSLFRDWSGGEKQIEPAQESPSRTCHKYVGVEDAFVQGSLSDETIHECRSTVELRRNTFLNSTESSQRCQCNKGRRVARAKALIDLHANDEHARYVDAAEYQLNAFAAVVIEAATRATRTAASVKSSGAEQAEEVAIADPGCHTVLSD
ncbi:hypothetical protein MTO96_033780 [Rhipicephalus appendiculatus]